VVTCPDKLALNMIEGRTGGGETGRTVIIIHSGREKSGSKPSALRSSFEILLKISRTCSGAKSIFCWVWACSSSFLGCHTARILRAWGTVNLGCTSPHPPCPGSPSCVSASQTILLAQRSDTAFRRPRELLICRASANRLFL